MRVRKAETEDGDKLLSVFRKLDSETKFMLFEPEERKTTVEEQEEIMGFTLGMGNELKRNKHTLYCVIGILQRYTGNGVGRTLLRKLEEWAFDAGFHRLELTVMEHNERAKRLYLSLGFQSEGIRRDSLKIDGKFINEIYMSKLI